MDVVGLQEHHLLSWRIETEEARARSIGWKCSMTPAEGGIEQGSPNQGGVGLAVDPRRGLSKVDAKGWTHRKGLIADGRLQMPHWSGLVKGGILIGSGYLLPSVGPAGNRALCITLAEWLNKWGRPYVFMMDAQMTKQEFIDSGLSGLFNATIFEPDGGEPTIFPSIGTPRAIDLFLVHNDLVGRKIACFTWSV